MCTNTGENSNDHRKAHKTRQILQDREYPNATSLMDVKMIVKVHIASHDYVKCSFTRMNTGDASGFIATY